MTRLDAVSTDSLGDSVRRSRAQSRCPQCGAYVFLVQLPAAFEWDGRADDLPVENITSSEHPLDASAPVVCRSCEWVGSVVMTEGLAVSPEVVLAKVKEIACDMGFDALFRHPRVQAALFAAYQEQALLELSEAAAGAVGVMEV